MHFETYGSTTIINVFSPEPMVWIMEDLEDQVISAGSSLDLEMQNFDGITGANIAKSAMICDYNWII